MDHFQNQMQPSHTYRLKWWMRGLLLTFSLGGVGVAVFFLAQIHGERWQNPTFLLTFSAAMFVIGLYCGFATFHYFVSLDAELVSVGGIFQTRTLRRASVRGFRTVYTRNSSYFIIESKDPSEKSLKITDYFNFDDAWAEWLQSLPNLDEEDSRAMLETIANSPDLGETPEARLEKLREAKTIAIVLNTVAISAACSLWFFGKFMEVILFRSLLILLAFLPWAVLWIQTRRPLLYNLFGRKQDPRPTLAFVVIVSGFGILVPTLEGIYWDNHAPLLVYGVAVGLLLVFLLKSTTHESKRRLGEVISLGAFCCVYGYGLTTLINTQIDNSSPREYSTVVLNMRITQGKSATYYLELSPWESSIGDHELSVPSSLYRSVEIGSPVCITAHEGALKAGWYTVHLCR